MAHALENSEEAIYIQNEMYYQMSEDKSKIPFTVFSPKGKALEKGPIFKGKDFSQPDIICDGCGYLIAQGIKYEQIQNIFSDCPKCGTLYHHPIQERK